MASTILSDNGVTSGSAGIKQTADNSGVLALQTTTAGGTATTALTIDTSQNVGLGVTPSAWSGATALQVGQYTSISGNSSYSGVGTNFFATSAGYATKYINNGYAAFYSQSASSGQHQWFTAPSGTAGNAITFTQAMTLDASGNLLVGTTTAISGSGAKMQVKGGASLPVGAFDCQQASGIFYFYYQGSLVGNISTNGSNLTLNSTSDYRRKENIAPLTGALDKIALLRPVSYKWKDSGLDGQGFIAHELQAVVPECVTGEKDAVDAEGKPVYQGIDTSFLVATLTAAIQEQQALIQQLQADVAALKGA